MLKNYLEGKECAACIVLKLVILQQLFSVFSLPTFFGSCFTYKSTDIRITLKGS